MSKNKIQKINTTAVLLIGIALVTFIVLRILYPRNNFSSEKNNMTVVSSFFVENGETREYLSVAPQVEHNFYSTKLRSTTGFENQKEINLHKGFLAQLYPLGEEISSAEELKEFIFSNGDIPNGELITNKDAVYVYSRGKWRPFLGAQIFENLGYDWDRIGKLSDKQISLFEEGERIIFRSAHPDGTVFETKESQLFLVWEEQLLPIKSSDLLGAVLNDYFTIKIDERRPKKVANCNVASQVKCELPKNIRTKNILGNLFIFSLGEESEERQGIEVVLNSFNVLDLDNPKLTMSVHKQRILEKYGEEIFK